MTRIATVTHIHGVGISRSQAASIWSLPGIEGLLGNRLMLRGGISETPAVDSVITPDSSNEAEGRANALGYFAVPSAHLCANPHRQKTRIPIEAVGAFHYRP